MGATLPQEVAAKLLRSLAPGKRWNRKSKGATETCAPENRQSDDCLVRRENIHSSAGLVQKRPCEIQKKDLRMKLSTTAFCSASSSKSPHSHDQHLRHGSSQQVARARESSRSKVCNLVKNRTKSMPGEDRLVHCHSNESRWGMPGRSPLSCAEDHGLLTG